MLKQRTPAPWTLAAAATISVLLMAGCERRAQDETVGQKIDQAVEKTEQRAEQAKNEMSAAADKAGAKVEDATITAKVKAELARDPNLSAMSINVDTAQGLVSLSGKVPDNASREHASRVAATVQGVVSVNNNLVVAS